MGHQTLSEPPRRSGGTPHPARRGRARCAYRVRRRLKQPQPCIGFPHWLKGLCKSNLVGLSLPLVALSITGSPCSRTKRCTSARVAPTEPGATGTFSVAASARACTLSPNKFSASGDGPGRGRQPQTNTIVLCLARAARNTWLRPATHRQSGGRPARTRWQSGRSRRGSHSPDEQRRHPRHVPMRRWRQCPSTPRVP